MLLQQLKAQGQQRQLHHPSQSKPTATVTIQTMEEKDADVLVLSQLSLQRVTYPMRNLGNTCFFNAVMQCLTHTQPLIKLCLSQIHTSTCRKGPDCFLCLYTKFVRGIAQNKSTQPGIVVQQLRKIWPRYSLGRQEDAHEFLMIFIDSFLNSCFQTAKPPRDLIWKNQEKTPIFKIFGGKLRSQVHCLGCNYKSNTYEDMSALSLDLPQGRGGFGQSLSIETLLSNFCKAEMLKGQNKYSCSKCNKKCEAVKKFTIEKSPRILLIHLKRFTNMGNKIKDFIKYPKQFSLKQFMSETPNPSKQLEMTKSGGQPQKQILQGGEIYDLYGVVVHQGGGCRSGHYYSYAKGIDAQWYCCNDEFISKLKSNDEELNQQAYILFYQKRIVIAPVQLSVPNQDQKVRDKIALEKEKTNDQKLAGLSHKSTSISSQGGSEGEGVSPNIIQALNKKQTNDDQTLSSRTLKQFQCEDVKQQPLNENKPEVVEISKKQFQNGINEVNKKNTQDAAKQNIIPQQKPESANNILIAPKKFNEIIQNTPMEALVATLLDNKRKDEDILWPATKAPIGTTTNQDEQQIKNSYKNDLIVKEKNTTEILQNQISPSKNPFEEKSKNIKQQTSNKSPQKNLEVLKPQNTEFVAKAPRLRQTKLIVETNPQEKKSIDVSEPIKKLTPTSSLYNIRSLRKDLHPIVSNTETRKRKRCAMEAVSTMHLSLEQCNTKKRKPN